MTQTSLARKMTFSLFVAVLAGSWDVWWHGAIGRDSFWEPPHLLLYSAVLATIIFGWFGFHRFPETRWRRIMVALALIILSAPMDDLWHRIFGVENLNSIFVIWSPPHVILILSLIFSFLSLLPVVLEDKHSAAKTLFGSIILASVASLGMLLAGPLEPTGPFHLFGFAGAGFVVFPLILSLGLAKQVIGGYQPAIMTSLFLIMLASFRFGEQIAPGIEIIPHDHAPGWLTIFAILLCALIVDFWHKHPMLSSIVAAATYSVFLYGISSFFLIPEFRFELPDARIALASGLIGGAMAGVLIGRVGSLLRQDTSQTHR